MANKHKKKGAIMGQLLLSFYDTAKAKGGASMQVKLAMVTKISAVKAASEPDSSENIKKFQDALKQLMG